MSTTGNKIGAVTKARPRAGGYWSERFVRVLAVIALAASVLLVMPLDPSMPRPGLDPSWCYALNEAVANHLLFGRDIIFTFGPLASVDTHLYHPATDRIMLVHASVVSLGIASGFALLAFLRRPLMLWLLPAAILITKSNDAYLLSLPLCLLLASLLVASKDAATGILPYRKGTLILFSSLACAIGLLPIIKGSFIGVAGALGALSVIILARSGHVRLATCLVMLAVAAMCAGWALSGQPLHALPEFFRSQAEIIAGYNDAMAIDGPRETVIVWAIPSGLILATFYWNVARHEGLNGLLATAGFAAFLFVAYKAGFVRQDERVISIECLLFAALAVMTRLEARQALVVGIIVFASWAKFEHTVDNLTLTSLRNRVTTNISNPVTGIMKRAAGQLGRAYDTANEAVRHFYQQAPISGTVDVYPYEQAVVFANHSRWAGRPIIQSYAAYTPRLDRINAEHLLGDNAPHTVLFDVAPIDDRLSTLEDASSWPILLTSYSAAWEGHHFIGLERGPSARPPKMTELGRATAMLNQPVSVPQLAGPVMVQIEMTPSLRGQLRSFLFRPPLVYIDLFLSDGRVIRHRYIPPMGATGFLLSPYIASKDDYLALAGGVYPNVVQRFSIAAPGAVYWRPNIRLVFSTFALSPQPSARKLLFAEPTTPPSALAGNVAFPQAQCSLDLANGSLVQASVRTISATGTILKLEGWAAPSASSGIAPEEIWVRLTAANGSPRFYRARLIGRPDVNKAYDHPDLDPTGFSLNIDMSMLAGEQNLAIFAVRNGQAFDCGIAHVIDMNHSGTARKE